MKVDMDGDMDGDMEIDDKQPERNLTCNIIQPQPPSAEPAPTEPAYQCNQLSEEPFDDPRKFSFSYLQKEDMTAEHIRKMMPDDCNMTSSKLREEKVYTWAPSSICHMHC